MRIFRKWTWMGKERFKQNLATLTLARTWFKTTFVTKKSEQSWKQVSSTIIFQAKWGIPQVSFPQTKPKQNAAFQSRKWLFHVWNLVGIEPWDNISLTHHCLNNFRSRTQILYFKTRWHSHWLIAELCSFNTQLLNSDVTRKESVAVIVLRGI